MNKHPLAVWRRKMGYSQQQLADILTKKLNAKKPVAQKTIFEWENGTTPRVDVAEVIEKLSKSAVFMTDWKKWKKAKKVID